MGSHGWFQARISPTATTTPGSALGMTVSISSTKRPRTFVLTTIYEAIAPSRPVTNAVATPSERDSERALSAPAPSSQMLVKFCSVRLSGARPPEMVRDSAVARMARSGAPAAMKATSANSASTGTASKPSGRLTMACGLPLTVWKFLADNRRRCTRKAENDSRTKTSAIIEAPDRSTGQSETRSSISVTSTVKPMRWPSAAGVPYSSIAMAKTNSRLAARPGSESGNVMRQKACQGEAPKTRPTSAYRAPTAASVRVMAK